jgi:translation initiation factor 2 subunit 3
LQAEINIGLLGHVDHGKTTLTKSLSGKWTATHSEELKRGISIRMGYADATTRYCEKCKTYSFDEKCKTCGSTGKVVRRISFLDAPGHETLMTTAISASTLIDGALFLIAANEPCPQPQTAEHLMVLNAMGIKNIIIVQTKVDLVDKDKAIENYRQIKEFVKGSVAENAPIVPISANHNVNIEKLVGYIEKVIPTPARDKNAKLRMYISRSFDVNRPGTDLKKLKGGVLGGSIVSGSLKVGDMVELKPGITRKEGSKTNSLKFKVTSLREENDDLTEATAGGLVAVGTELDPAVTKSDALIGSVIGKVGDLPEVSDTVKIKYELLERKDMENPPLKMGEPVVVNAHTATNVGVIMNLAKGIATVKMKKICLIEAKTKVALSRRMGQRWRLAGWGEVVA